jgi:hypothetical protein
MKQAQALMREGKVQEADDLLTQGLAASSVEAGSQTAAAAAPTPPRAVPSILTDIFDTIHSLLGAPPQLEGLLTELKSIETWF